MKNRSLFYGFAALIVLGSFFLISASVESPGTDTSTIISQQEWIKGNSDSTISIVEYSDFQCPACAYNATFVKQAEAEFGDHIKIVYRNFPLSSHKNARIAAYSAEAAGLQDKFWEMHDLIFENQSEWSPLSNSEAKTTFENYATQLNLDLQTFKQDRDSSAVRKAVEADLSAGEQASVTGTPTFFLNGQPLTLSRYEQARKTIADTIRENQ